MTKIGFGITGSFCTINDIKPELRKLIRLGYDVYPITSIPVSTWDTRAGKSDDLKKSIEDITGKPILADIPTIEPLGPSKTFDIFIVAPATSTFLSDFNHARADDPVTFAAKGTQRNNKPVLIGVSTNDGLRKSSINIAYLMNTKDVYFIPYRQDDYHNKPNSLVAKFDLLIPAMEKALEKEQYQPVILGPKKVKQIHK
jgi:dipicolinate synthase subunit B